MVRGKKHPEERYRHYWKQEIDSALLYYALAKSERDPQRAQTLREMADMEVKHAAYWASKLGIEQPDIQSQRPSLRTRTLITLARWFGTRRVIPLMLRDEYRGINAYLYEPAGVALVEDERHHAQALEGLVNGRSLQDTLKAERRHRGGNSGSYRAAVLGFNDGLVSNFSLVMGVAGGTSDARIILLAGIAGLLAGAFSMAAGEYVSMRAQRDLYEHEIEVEKAELEAFPEEEKKELELIYRAKGLAPEDARLLADRILSNHDIALDTMAREELGLDPEELGSPWGASLSSFFSFGIGAIVPVIPYLLGNGNLTIMLSALFAGAALLGAGAFLAALTSRNPIWGGLRMLLIGAASAAVTFGIGRLIGVSIT